MSGQFFKNQFANLAKAPSLKAEDPPLFVLPKLKPDPPDKAPKPLLVFPPDPNTFPLLF